MDMPQSPVASLPSHSRYWTCHGRSRPSWAARAFNWSSVAYSPRIITAALPGRIMVIAKTAMETTSRTSTTAASRRARYPAFTPRQPRSSQTSSVKKARDSGCAVHPFT